MNQQYKQVCRLIDEQSLWGERIYRVWLPDRDAIVQIQSNQLKPLDDTCARISSHHINYVSSAVQVADALTHDLSTGQAGIVMAPIESSVICLPHQIRALSRAISNDRVRYLLGNEVGLGETIEAGHIMLELKLQKQIDGERRNG